jgi:uncharacterized membrane protein
MESRAKLFGHPVHQMLVTFPIGALGLSVAADLLHVAAGERKYSDAAALALDFGLATGAVAIPFGLIDWLAIPRGTRARRIGLLHALGNAGMLGLFAASRWLRAQDRDSVEAKCLSGAAFMLSGVAAWLGGELVDRHGIGVKEMPVGAGEEDPSALPMSDDAPTLRGYIGQRSPNAHLS